MQYAGRLSRFAAFVIDFIVLLVFWSILNAIGLIDTNPFDDTEVVETVDGLVQALVAFGYFLILTAVFGATLGKVALGMRVVDKDGNKAGLGPVLIREVIARALGAIITAVVGASIGDLVGLAVGIIIIIMILFDERRQGLHDKIGGTFVVRAPR